MQVSKLHIYPMKSARGLPLDISAVDAFGLKGDRRAMLATPDGNAITQRELTTLARLIVQPQGLGLSLALDGHGGHVQVRMPDGDERMAVDVWGTKIDAAVCDEAVNRLLSNWFGQPVKLVFFDDRSQRGTSVTWTGKETPVRFADGYQILVTTTASLAALNDNMAAQGEGRVDMDRFRPNIVIDGATPWAEDLWEAIEIDGLRFDLVKPCSRCIMTTQDQASGSRNVPSPMPAMGRLRMSADRRVPGPLFGWNAVPRDEGVIKTGSTVHVLTQRNEGWALKRRG